MTSNIVIIGGGVIGLTTAIAMHQRGHRVKLLEAGTFTSNNHDTPRLYALNRTSKTLLCALTDHTFWNALHGEPYQSMHVWDALNGAALDIDASLIARDCLGTFVDEQVLKQHLWQQAQKLSLELYPQHPLTAIHPSEQGVRLLTPNATFNADLVMIADGAHSSTRTLLDVPLTTWSYHQAAVIATVRMQTPRPHTAYQVFHPDGPVAFLPMKTPQEGSVVWSTPTQKAQQLMACDTQTFEQRLTQAFQEKLGACTLLGQRKIFPLHMRHVKNYTGTRWLLLGDAAHTLHPLAGLGLNLGLADLSTWLHLIDHHNQPLWSSRVLGAYQRERKHALWQNIALMEGIKLFFANPMLASLRQRGLQACNQMPWLKRLLIHHVD